MSTRTQNENQTDGDDDPMLQQEDKDIDDEAEEEEVLKLEEEVEQLAARVLEYRTTLPDQLNSTLASLLSSQRPVIPPTRLSVNGSDPGPDAERGPNPGVAAGEANATASLVGEDQEEVEKLELLKQKISSNAAMMPIVLKRMKDNMARMEKLESSNVVIHPAFKRKRTS